jgi:hypothetical protein
VVDFRIQRAGVDFSTGYEPPSPRSLLRMKSCLGLLFTLSVFTFVVGGGALIWYLSHSAEFSRTDGSPSAATANPPKAIPVR